MRGKDNYQTDNEGNSDNAKGVGFVVSSPSSGDTVLINNQFVKLADLASGINNVPLKLNIIAMAMR